MGQSVSVAPSRAIVAGSATGSVSEISEITSGLDSDDSDWFGSVARGLLGKEPGVELHYITGFPASTCAKYTSKTEASRRQPPGYFIRALLRSEQGEPFLRAIMGGSQAAWWRDYQHAASVGSKVLEITKRE